MLKVLIHGYKTIEEGQDSIDTTLAKQDLIQHTYNKYYVKSSKSKQYLKLIIDEKNDAYYWPVGEEQTLDNVTSIKMEERCYCNRCVSF